MKTRLPYIIISIVLSGIIATFSSCKNYRVSPDQSEYFIKFLGGPSIDEGKMIRSTSDGGYIIAGSITSSTLGHKQAYIAKLDPKGDIQWQRAFGDTTTYGTSVNIISSGGYILCGYEMNRTGGILSSNIALYKLDNNGNLLKSKIYPKANFQQAHDIIELVNGNYIVAGGDSIATSETVTARVYIMDKSLDGSMIDGGGTTAQTFFKKIIYSASDDRYYCSGSSAIGNVFLQRYSANGTSTGAGSDATRSGLQIPSDIIIAEGSLYIVGTDYLNNGDVILYKYGEYTDAAEGTNISSTFPFSSQNSTLGKAITYSAGELAIGLTINEGGNTNKGLMKVSTTDLRLLSLSSYGFTSDETTNEIALAIDGGFVLIGNTSIEPGTNTMIEIIKVKPNGTLQPE